MFSEEDGVNDVRRLGVVKALHGVCRRTIKRQVMGDGRCNTILIVLLRSSPMRLHFRRLRHR